MFAAGRWHTKGTKVVYTAENVAAAALEMVVHMEIDSEDVPSGFVLLGIELADSMEIFEPNGLPPNWRDDRALTQQLGDEWVRSARTPLMRVPSSITPRTSNILINPSHPGARGLAASISEPFSFDPRLLK